MKRWQRTIAYLVTLCVILTGTLLAGRVLSDKGKESETFSAYSSVQGFYELPQNSLDVLYLGTSAAYCGFDPRVLKEETGLDGWNLGSSQQSLLSSYWWLREASETGRLKPGATVYLEMFYGYYAVGNEGSLHKALDWMKPSLRKGQAILDLCSLYPEYQPLDFLLPALRFHDRWTDLTVQDWNPDTLLEQNRDYRGYCPRMEVVGEEFLPLDRSLDLPKEKTRNRSDFAEEAPQQLQGMPLMYLHKITTYCREQGFHLVLVKTPTTEWTMAQHDSVVAFADAQGLAFVDFNMKNVFADAKYDFSLCNADHMHANQAGAALLTSYLTKVE